MSLPERLYDLNKDEDGYGYYYRDEKGEMVTMSTYTHWHKGKNYHLIWENMAEYCEVAPAVYGSQDEEGIYERILDEKLVGEIFESYHSFVSQPILTDGPAWFYENNNPLNRMPVVGMMTPEISAMMMGKNTTESSRWDYSDIKTEIKFCPNCGTKREGQVKFCSACGTRLSK